MNEVWVVMYYRHESWNVLGVAETRGLGKAMAGQYAAELRDPIQRWEDGVRRSVGQAPYYEWQVKRYAVERVADDMGG